LIIVALVLLIAGHFANKQMSQLASTLTDEAAVRKAFADVDSNNDGQLDLGELARLLTQLSGRTPSHAELEVDMRELDSDMSGTISVEELLGWWGKKKVTEAIRMEELLYQMESSSPTSIATASDAFAVSPAASASTMNTASSRGVKIEDSLDTPLLVNNDESDVENAQPQPEPESQQQVPGIAAHRDYTSGSKKVVSDVAATVGSVAHASADRARRLKTWAVGTGPTSIRVLSVLSGLLLCTVSVFVAVIGNIFRSFNLLKIIVDGLLFAGGLLIIVIDGPMTPMLPLVRSQLKVLSTVVGRGIYQCLIALLALSQGWTDFSWGDPLTNVGALLYISCAAILLIMGVLFMVAGIAAGAQLDKLKTTLQSRTALKEAFDNADVDNSGALDSAELARLASSLGSELTPRQLEVAIDLLDIDRDGTVSYEEFCAWWGAQPDTA
jgi:Ca2+-binding EF-hand superfamily protein